MPWSPLTAQNSGSAIFNDFVREALEIIQAADKNGIPLRLIGALGIYHHCTTSNHLYERIERIPTDIDLIGYSKHSRKLIDLMKSLGYTPSAERLMVLYGNQRQMYQSASTGRQIDVFFDKLEMCHTVNLKGRLELDSPTITLADFLLEKMQIVEINEKDIKDTIIMLREHDLGGADRDKIDIDYISKLLSSDWGFYYTVTTNLKKILQFLPAYDALGQKDRETVSQRVNRILGKIENEPKSLSWKIRERQGTKKKWYRDVEVQRGAWKMEDGQWIQETTHEAKG